MIDGYENYRRQKRAELLIETIAVLLVGVFLLAVCR
jgi:hypothetical protein